MSKQDLDFAETRFDYCEKIYKIEDETRQNLEKKTEIYFSIISIFLGAIFLNFDYVTKLANILKSCKLAIWAVFLSQLLILIFVITLFLGLVFLLISYRLRSYQSESPKKITESLFSPESNFLEERSRMQFFKIMGMEYALAIEQNRKVNEGKAALLGWVEFFITTAVLCLFFIVVVIGYVLLT